MTRAAGGSPPFLFGRVATWDEGRCGEEEEKKKADAKRERKKNG